MFISHFYSPPKKRKKKMEASTWSSSNHSLKGVRLSPPRILGRPPSQRVNHTYPRLSLRAVVSVRGSPLSSTPSSAPTPENPGEPVTDASAPGGNGFDGNGGNGKLRYGGGGEEEAREDSESLARFVELMNKKKKRESEESGGRLGLSMETYRMLRERTMPDPSFIFKFITEIVIGSCCAKMGELQRRGKGFLAEFQQYAADLLVGMVSNVSLLHMMAPYVRSSHPFASRGNLGGLQHAFGALSSSAFGAALHQRISDYLFKAVMDGASRAAWSACKFSVKQIVGSRFYKGAMYGFACGIICHGTANLITAAMLPPNLMSAALLGGVLFVAVNQIMESQKEASPMAEKVPPAAIDERILKARRFPPVSLKLTAGLQFANHAYDAVQYGSSGLRGVRCSNTQSCLSIGLSLTTLVD